MCFIKPIPPSEVMQKCSNPNYQNKPDVWLSKTLSKLLRHDAIKEGLSISPEGFVPVSELLQHRFLQSKCTLKDVQRVVDGNDKQRFTLRRNPEGIWEIRANQGHSLQVSRLSKASLSFIRDSVNSLSFRFITKNHYKNLEL